MKYYRLSISILLSALMTSACATQPTVDTDYSPTTITGNGTEPFWNFNVSGTNLQLFEPSDSGPMTETNYTITMSTNGDDIVISDNNMITMTITPQSCSDGMSDITYTHKSILVRNNVTRYGCANTTP